MQQQIRDCLQHFIPPPQRGTVVLLCLVSGHGGGLGGLTVPPCLRDISKGEKWVLLDGTLPPQGSASLPQSLTKTREFPKHNA